MFLIYSMTGGEYEKHYNQKVAFEKAANLSYKADDIAIIETRWSVNKKCLERFYYNVMRGSIYRFEDIITPVFSIDPMYEKIMQDRAGFIKNIESCNKLDKNLKDIEYHSYTLGQLVKIEEEMKNLPSVVAYTNRIREKNSRVWQTLNYYKDCLRIDLENYKNIILTTNYENLEKFLDFYLRRLNYFITAFTYGGMSELENFLIFEPIV
jgi:hypothetical protein